MTEKTLDDMEVTASYSYDSLGRLKTVARGGHDYSYGYDLANNRTSESVDGVNRSFAYNWANRLTGHVSVGIV